MLDTIRYHFGAVMMKKAAELIETGDYNNLIKGLKLVHRAVRIVPPSEELTNFKQEMRNLVEKYSEEKEES